MTWTMASLLHIHILWILLEGISGLTVTTGDNFAKVKAANITLPCSFNPPTTPDNYVLQWKKGNNTVYAFDDPGQDGPISAPGDPTRYTRENTDLHIRNFQLVDHGEFCCEIQTTTPPENVVTCITAVFIAYNPDDSAWTVVDENNVHLTRAGTYTLRQERMQLTVSYTDVHPAADLVLYEYEDGNKVQKQRQPKPTTAGANGLYSLTMDIDRTYTQDTTMDLFLEGNLITKTFRIYMELYIDPCLSNPCQNGGTCTDTKDGSYRCTCTANYEGPTCGERVPTTTTTTTTTTTPTTTTTTTTITPTTTTTKTPRGTGSNSTNRHLPPMLLLLLSMLSCVLYSN